MSKGSEKPEAVGAACPRGDVTATASDALVITGRAGAVLAEVVTSAATDATLLLLAGGRPVAP